VRRDIQGLRGIAVLLVIAYHARIGILEHGYLGVDVFFVISGFLITGLISRELGAGRFSFSRFYWRRAKRLLPAAYALLLVTSIAAVLLLTSLELRAYRAQAFGAVTLSANYFLWTQTRYFGGSGDLKPLLHMWSLSLEEQFYLFFPFALWVTPARFRRWMVGALLAGSMALCLVMDARNPSIAFYSLPTRAWELMLGALGALTFRGSAPATRLAHIAGSASLIMVLVFSTIALDGVHPRLDALLVCLATLAAIWARPSLLVEGPVSRVLSRAGDMSYSLYLVHWPIFAFANHIFLQEVPLSVRLAAIPAAIVLSVLLYRVVENPIHRSTVVASLGRVVSLVAVSVTIIAIPSVAYRLRTPARDWAVLRRANVGLSAACDHGGDFVVRQACRTKEHPKVLVWGDSFAMHLVPGLVATDPGLGIAQATFSSCGPVLGLAPALNGADWARDCKSFNASVLEYVRRSPDIEYVVVSFQVALYSSSEARAPAPQESDARREVFVRRFEETLQAVREAGKKVLIVAPMPSAGADYGLCLERLSSDLLTVSSVALAGCAMDEATAIRNAAQVTALLSRVATESGVTVVWPSAFLCEAGRCQTVDGDVPIYRDPVHLSNDGSIVFARRSQLLRRLPEWAR
jgi:peptidoglycan/LPS O-acetylase OafA/YrhL